MNVTTKRISVKDVYDAIAVDGYEHLREDWITFKSFNGSIRPIGGCLVGMAAINLGVVPEYDWLNDHSKGALRDAINGWGGANFDQDDDDDVEILGLLEGLNNLYIPSTFQTPEKYSARGLSLGLAVGDALVALNDAKADDGKFLFSYEELTQFAHELLESHFDKFVAVTQIDYTDASILQ